MSEERVIIVCRELIAKMGRVPLGEFPAVLIELYFALKGVLKDYDDHN